MSLTAGYLPSHDGAKYIKTPTRRKGENEQTILITNVFRQVELNAAILADAVST